MNAYRFLLAKLLRKLLLERSRKRWIDEIKMGRKKLMGVEGGRNWIRTIGITDVETLNSATRPLV
jgi:hypothetical protein